MDSYKTPARACARESATRAAGKAAKAANAAGTKCDEKTTTAIAPFIMAASVGSGKRKGG